MWIVSTYHCFCEILRASNLLHSNLINKKLSHIYIHIYIYIYIYIYIKVVPNFPKAFNRCLVDVIFSLTIFNVSKCLRLTNKSQLLLFWIRNLSHTGGSVLLKRRNCVKKERVFEDDVFIENTRLGSGSKRRTKFTRGRTFTQVTWFSWPMVSWDWICVRPPSLLWEQVAYCPN